MRGLNKRQGRALHPAPHEYPATVGALLGRPWGFAARTGVLPSRAALSRKARMSSPARHAFLRCRAVRSWRGGPTKRDGPPSPPGARRHTTVRWAGYPFPR